MRPYANCVVYGPYTRKDGRQHVICIFPNKLRKTISFPKYIVEKNIGRLLQDQEEIHHIDGDFTNNDLSNLEIVDKKDHVLHHTIKYVSTDFCCPVCGTEFTLSGKQLSNLVRERNRNKAKTGPYCSRQCAGRGSNVRIEIDKNLISLLSDYKETYN